MSNQTEKFTRYHVPNLVRGLHIMEFLASRPAGCGISEIAEALDISKNSAFRVSATLSDFGYLERDEDSKSYRLSRKLLALGYAAIDEYNIVEKSLDILRQLRDKTGETVMLAEFHDAHGTVVAQAPSRRAIKVLVQVGHRFPLHSAAPGKAYMASLPETEREALIKTMRYKRFTDRTIRGRAAMRIELARVRELGYAVDNGEEDEDIGCVGAAVLDGRGYPVGAVWASGPLNRLRAEHFDKIGPMTVRAAARVSQRLGGSAPAQVSTGFRG